MSGDTALTSVLQFAERSHVFEIAVKLFLAYGADINAKSCRYKTSFQIACSRNFGQVAELLLELGCATNSKNFDFCCSIHHAAEYDNGKLTEVLLQYGADVSAKEDVDEMTPLYFAARANSVLAAQVLLQHGAEVEAVNKAGSTPFAEAAKHGSLSMVKLLLENAANVLTKDKLGKTPLIFAVEHRLFGNHESTPLDHGSSVNATDHNGRSAIHYVHPDATSQLFDLLLYHGASVNAPDKNGETPLHFAASCGNTAYIEWLFEQGADVGALDIENRTPCNAACSLRGDRSSVELLIQHGAGIHLADNEGWLPLHLTVLRECFDVAEILVNNGSAVAAVDKKGRTVLHLAAKEISAREMTEFLIHHSVHINARDFRGQTVLVAISESGHSHFWTGWNFIQVYLDNGGDAFAVDGINGGTVLHFAAAFNFTSSLDNILNQGLKLEARDKNGDTPLHKAAAYGTTEKIQGLIERGVDLLAVNKKGRTPLLVSLRSNVNKNGSEILLKTVSSVQVADEDGNTTHFPVHDSSLVRKIIENGGDVNAVNVRGCTPLNHQAAYYRCNLNTIRLLLKAGANFHCRDDQGCTPFHIAVARSSDAIVELLIASGRDFHASDIQAKRVHTLTRFGACKMLKKLIVHGVHVNAVDELGSTSLHLALQRNERFLVEVLLKQFFYF